MGLTGYCPLPVQIYLLLLFLRVLLSWFPAFNWERQPWLALRQVACSLQVSHPFFFLFKKRCRA